MPNMNYDKPTRLWQAIERWYRFHPIVLMYVAGRAVNSKGHIGWLDRADKTTLGLHCSRYDSCAEAWMALPFDERRNILRTAQVNQQLATAQWDDVALAFGKLVEDDRGRDKPVAHSLEVRMVVPDELLAWADAQQISWPRPWGTEARELLASEEPLGPDATSRLLNRLDAIAAEAIRSRRFDLCMGFDTMTAELIGLSYLFECGSKRVSLGVNGQWTFHELEVTIEAGDPVASRLAVQAKELVSQAFPGMRIQSVKRVDEDPACASCKREIGLVSMQMASGDWSCAECWRIMTRPPTRPLASAAEEAPREARQGVIQGTRGRR